MALQATLPAARGLKRKSQPLPSSSSCPPSGPGAAAVAVAAGTSARAASSSVAATSSSSSSAKAAPRSAARSATKASQPQALASTPRKFSRSLLGAKGSASPPSAAAVASSAASAASSAAKSAKAANAASCSSSAASKVTTTPKSRVPVRPGTPTPTSGTRGTPNARPGTGSAAPSAAAAAANAAVASTPSAARAAAALLSTPPPKRRRSSPASLADLLSGLRKPKSVRLSVSSQAKDRHGNPTPVPKWEVAQSTTLAEVVRRWGLEVLGLQEKQLPGKGAGDAASLAAKHIVARGPGGPFPLLKTVGDVSSQLSVRGGSRELVVEWPREAMPSDWRRKKPAATKGMADQPCPDCGSTGIDFRTGDGEKRLAICVGCEKIKGAGFGRRGR